jgi:hypothetical protein
MIGAWFLEVFDVRLTMTWWSAIFATTVVIFPLMYRTARGAFESFDENGVQESENHHFFGDIIRVFMNYLAGIHIARDKNGKPQITVSPVIVPDMNYAYGEIEIDGHILRAGWTRKEEGTIVWVDLPIGICARFVNESCSKVLMMGHNEFII